MSNKVDNPRQKLAVCGYLRNIISDENDYNVIILIIISYYKQGIVTYFDDTDQDYNQKMRFGDIVKMGDASFDFMGFEEYMALDMNNKLIRIGECSMYRNSKCIDVYFPFSICKYLDNAVSFYSKFHAMFSLMDLRELTFSFFVKHTDEWIINHLNGPLNLEYESIKLEFENYECKGIRICFAESDKGKFEKRFEPNGNSFAISYKDIDEFYQLRKDKNNLIKIRISLESKSAAYYALKRYKVEQVLFLWKEDWSQLVANGFIDFVGPKTQKVKLINTIESVCQMSVNNAMSFVSLDKSDYIS